MVSAHANAASPLTEAAPRGRMATFLGVFILPGIAQSILLTVVPLEALRLLGTARAVTLLYAVAGLAAVVGRFSIPVLVQLIQRRFVFSLGASQLAISAVLLASGSPAAFALGLAFRSKDRSPAPSKVASRQSASPSGEGNRPFGSSVGARSTPSRGRPGY